TTRRAPPVTATHRDRAPLCRPPRPHDPQRRGGQPTYSPKIPVRLIPGLYHVARARRMPMTRLVAEVLETYLAGQERQAHDTSAKPTGIGRETSPSGSRSTVNRQRGSGGVANAADIQSR